MAYDLRWSRDARSPLHSAIPRSPAGVWQTTTVSAGRFAEKRPRFDSPELSDVLYATQQHTKGPATGGVVMNAQIRSAAVDAAAVVREDRASRGEEQVHHMWVSGRGCGRFWRGCTVVLQKRRSRTRPRRPISKGTAAPRRGRCGAAGAGGRGRGGRAARRVPHRTARASP